MNPIESKRRKIVRYFDKLEDKIRERLSRSPILYTFIGGTAIVIFWYGVWNTADYIFRLILGENIFWHGIAAIGVSVIILLATGLFVSFFIGDIIILSGLKGEKKIIDKTETEVQTETETLTAIKEELTEIKETVHELKESIDETKNLPKIE
ncbi:MAG: hypothetical protein HYT43_01890 [Candidatus Taylorbacteria bacterium]|nr:hypothetical protein [Candidatus Taylorbacteria bacterium]